MKFLFFDLDDTLLDFHNSGAGAAPPISAAVSGAEGECLL